MKSYGKLARRIDEYCNGTIANDRQRHQYIAELIKRTFNPLWEQAARKIADRYWVDYTNKELAEAEVLEILQETLGGMR